MRLSRIICWLLGHDWFYHTPVDNKQYRICIACKLGETLITKDPPVPSRH